MTRPSRAPGRAHDDRGSTMVAVLMVIMVVMVIGVASMQTAQHSNDVTSVDRERLQTIEAAEAGIHSAFDRAQTGTCDGSATAAEDLNDGDDLVGQFRTRVDPENGTTCGQTLRRVIHSWGYAPTGGTRALRHVEVTVELIPNNGFPYTLFAEGGTGAIYVKNNAQINGDVYAENLDQTKNNLSAEDVVSPDSIVTQNNAAYSGTLWAGGNVTVGMNSNIGGSILASGTKSDTAGDISIGSGTVGADVRAKGSVSLGDTTVHGSVSQNDPYVPAPPVLQKPAFTWSSANYDPAPTEGSAATITSALSANKDALSGTYYNNSGSTSAITIPDGAKVTGNLTIVSSGRVNLGNGFTAVGGPWTVVIVAQSTATNSIDADKAMTSASGIHLLLWTGGGVDLKNKVTMTGSIYANEINIKNGLTVNASTLLAQTAPPGFSFVQSSLTTYSAVPTLWREIVPGAPPD